MKQKLEKIGLVNNFNFVKLRFDTKNPSYRIKIKKNYQKPLSKRLAVFFKLFNTVFYLKLNFDKKQTQNRVLNKLNKILKIWKKIAKKQG